MRLGDWVLVDNEYTCIVSLVFVLDDHPVFCLVCMDGSRYTEPVWYKKWGKKDVLENMPDDLIEELTHGSYWKKVEKKWPR